MLLSLSSAAASPTSTEDDLWSDFVTSEQSEVCPAIFEFLAHYQTLVTLFKNIAFNHPVLTVNYKGQ